MVNKITPSPKIVGLAKFGLLPGIVIGAFFVIGGIVGILYFLGEYVRTNQEQPVILLFVAFLSLFVIIAALQIVTYVKIIKMKPKDISLQIDHDKTEE